MGLRLKTAAPGVEGVIERHAVLEHLVVVGKIRRQAERDGKEPAALWGKVVARGIRAAHDQSKAFKRGISDIVEPQEGVERTSFAFMAEFDVGNVVGDGAQALASSSTRSTGT